MLKQLGSAFVLFTLTLTFVAAFSTPASAKGGCNATQFFCDVGGKQPSLPPSAPPDMGGGGGWADGPAVGSAPIINPGPPKCEYNGKSVPCTNKERGVWNGAEECYMKLADDQSRPEGASGTGANYSCFRPPWECEAENDEPRGPFDRGMPCSSSSRDVWQDTPPPGIERLTPAQAAYELKRLFPLKGVQIGMAPKPEPGFKGSVGLPVWMWAENRTQDNWGPWTQSKEIGGVNISATAKVNSVTWDMGDGTTITCNGPGTPYDESKGITPSPDCGHVFKKMSKGQPGGKYTVTATSHWTFEWQAEGETGQDTNATTSEVQVEIGELQSVIIP